MIDADYVARLMVPYLPRQRWFSGGGGELREVRTVAHEVWRDEWPGLVWALVDAFVDERPPIRCQVFVGLRPLGERAEFLDGKGRWLLGDVVTDAGLVVTIPGTAPDPDVSVAALEFADPITVAHEGPMARDTGASGTLEDPSKTPH